MRTTEIGKTNPQQGFTLIELSIVLVIIGLIVGGVLVGQDLIKAATIRAQVSQIEKYNTAVSTFRSKYNGVPGDLRTATATSFGFVTRNGAVGRGDGNGLIESGGANGAIECGETVMFWNDLSTAGLISGNFQGGDGTPGNCMGSSATLPVSQIVPDAKLGRGNSVVIYADTGRNYYQIVAGIIVDTAGNTYNATLAMSPLEAFQIDSKIDDGYPTTGIVKTRDIGFFWNGPAPLPGVSGAPASGQCGNTDTTPTSYNNGSYPNAPVCSISIRAQF